MIKRALTKNAALKYFARSIFRFLAPSALGLAIFLAIHAPAFASNFSVTPTSLELAGGAKSGAFSIVNSGADPLNCQIEVKEWSQDPDGKDVFADAKDVVVFPKIMTVGPNEQRAVRVGVKGPPSLREKTYRLFAQEIPSQNKTAETKPAGKISAGLTIAFRYSVPIFVKPVRPQESAVIEKTEVSKGSARAVVRNTGNIHVKVLSVNFRGKSIEGKELFSQDVAGWYILEGISRSYEAPVPKAACKDLAVVDVSVQTENTTLHGTMNVQNTACGQ